MIWLFALTLALIAVGFVLLPIRTTGLALAPSGDNTLPVLKDQLEEVERDAARGLISEAESHAARVEIKRRILIASRRATGPTGTGGGRAAIWVAALFVPVFAAGDYFVSGTPDMPSLAFADRTAELSQRRQIEDLTRKLALNLNTDPEGGPIEGWMLLGQTYMKMRRAEDAAVAFENASGRPGADSAVFSMLGEALIIAEKGNVTPKARRAIARALELEPENPAANFYEALALAQSGNEAAAYDLLVKVLDQADGFAPWMATFVAEANRIGQPIGRPMINLADYAPAVANAPPGPTATDIAAASDLAPEDRAAFIRSMVERLATRLAAEPDDLDGWMRLGNAYRVLVEPQKALEAFEKAEALARALPESDPRPGVINQNLGELRGN